MQTLIDTFLRRAAALACAVVLVCHGPYPYVNAQEESAGLHQIVHNAPENLSQVTNASEVMNDNTLELLTDMAWRLFSDLTLEYSSRNHITILSGNEAELAAGNETELLSGNSPKLIAGNHLDYLSANQATLLSGNRTEVFSHNQTDIEIADSGNNVGEDAEPDRDLAAFQYGDTDQDGRLNLAEFRRTRSVHRLRQSRRHFQRLDKDADGLVTVSEWTNPEPR